MKYKLGDLIDTISDTRKILKNQLVLINTSDVLEGKVLNHLYTENSNLRGQFKKRFKKGDILYSEIRPGNRRFAYIDFDSEDYLASTKLMVLRNKGGIVDNSFLYLLLSGKRFTDDLQYIAEQRSGTFPQITFSELSHIEVNIPNLETQQKIVRILSTLDSKIELNNQQNQTIYELCESRYRILFGDRIRGEKKICDYILPKRGKSLLSKNAVKGIVPVIAGGLEPATYHNESNTKAPVISISASGANAGYVNIWEEEIWSSDSSFIDKTVTDAIYFWYLMLKTRQKEIYDSQTGSAQAHIYPKHIGDMAIGNINKEEMILFSEQISGMFEKIGQNKKQNGNLIQLRDTLLPKLMNGEINLDKVKL